MKTKKETRKRNSSSSSSSSSNSSSGDSGKSPSKSPGNESREKSQNSKSKRNSKEKPVGLHRFLNRDVKSKWDSPDDRAGHKKRQLSRNTTKHSSMDHIEKNKSGRRDISPDKQVDRCNDRDKPRQRHKSKDKDQDNSKQLRTNRNREVQEHGHHRDRQYNRRDVNNSRIYDNRERNERHRSRSPYRANDRRRRRSKSFDHSKAVWGKGGHNEKQPPDPPKEKPNFGLSGKLTEETNTYKGVVIKYSEPPEARKPKRRWRLYPFKGEKAMQTLYIHRESAYLVGRDRKVVDLPVDHPSCSKQHAAIQYRLVQFTRENGSVGKRVRPYLIDLESANGTYINNKKIEARKYVELLERDVIKFGFSSREYVLLHENSKDEAQDDDVNDEIPREATPTEA